MDFNFIGHNVYASWLLSVVHAKLFYDFIESEVIIREIINYTHRRVVVLEGLKHSLV